MSLLNLLPTSNLGLQGSTPSQHPSANPQSTLHYQSSINNNPALGANFPAPSVLDLDGQVPSISTVPGSTQQLPYINNLPG